MTLRPFHRGARALAYFCFALTSTLPAPAQSNLATIRGLVTDSQNAAVPDAKVTVVNSGTGLATAVQTNGAGFYSLPNLPIGVYSLTIKHDGFRTYLRDGISLTTGEVLGLDATLEVGAVSESVTVSGEAPLVESSTSSIGQLIASRSIEDLPLGDRQTLNVVKMLGAAVVASTATNSTSTPSFSLAGGRSEGQMSWIDGGNGQDMRLGTPGIDEDPPVETIQEIKVLANNYAAEYGGSAAGVIIMTTRSGTNQYHGSLYEYVRNDAFDAPGFFAPVQNGAKLAPELRYNVFGGTLGGPIRHDKTFFFVGEEESFRNVGSNVVLTVPTALQKAGDFSQTLNAKGQVIPIYDPATTIGAGTSATRTQFPGNVIPSSRLDPVALNVMTYFPLPNQAPSNLAGANNFSGNQVNTDYHYNITAKVDHNFSEKDKLTGRYLYNQDDNGLISVYAIPGADPNTIPFTKQNFFYGAWNHIVTPAQVNDLRFTYETRINNVRSLGLGGNFPEKLGVTGVPQLGFPQFNAAGFSGLGASNEQRQQYPVREWQLVDNYSWVHGRHAMKFGAEARRSSDHDVALATTSGAFTFATTGTGIPSNTGSGNGLATLLDGFVTAFSQKSTEPLNRQSWYLAGFVQDDWTVSERLTLNLGLRWETDTPMVDANNRMNGFDLNQINPISGTPGVVTFMGLNGASSQPWRTDWNNFGPRFGFAWKPFHSDATVVRGGFGIFYAHPFDGGAPTQATLGFSLSDSLSSPDNGITPIFYLRNGVPAGIAPSTSALDNSFGAVKVGQTPTTSPTYYDPSRRTGYAQQFNFGIQHQLPGSLVLEASALGNLSRKLAGASLGLDQILPQDLGPGCSTQACRPYPQFNGISILSPSIGVSNYYAGTVKAEKRFQHGLSFLATYTYSKFLENTNDGAGDILGNENGPYSNYYNRRADYGPSSNDIRHSFTFSDIYELPFGKGRRWLAASPLRYPFGGWSLGSLVNIHSGPPLTVITQTNNTNSFSAGAQRANLVGNSMAGPETVNEWFNTAAFAQPAIYQFGNEGVGLIRGPGLSNFDISVLRDFRATERLRAQFRAEFLNAFNHTNLGLPNSTFGNASFGIINSASPGRVIQLGARLTF